MVFTVWLIRILFAIWIFGVIFLIISKILANSETKEKSNFIIFFLFPILLLTKEGREKIKESIK